MQFINFNLMCLFSISDLVDDPGLILFDCFINKLCQPTVSLSLSIARYTVHITCTRTVTAHNKVHIFKIKSQFMFSLSTNYKIYTTVNEKHMCKILQDYSNDKASLYFF